MTTSFATDTFSATDIFSATDAYYPARFAPATASPRIRLGSATSTPRSGGRYEISAIFAIGDSIISSTRLAFGPVEALTDMLYDAGFAVEITSFGQRISEFGTVTTLRYDDRGTPRWACGRGDCATLSTARAMVAAANQLA